jgi:hypothetical protein
VNRIEAFWYLGGYMEMIVYMKVKGRKMIGEK